MRFRCVCGALTEIGTLNRRMRNGEERRIEVCFCNDFESVNFIDSLHSALATR